MNLIKKLKYEIVLDLSGSEFGSEDEKNFKKFIQKQNNLKDVILENTNFTKEAVLKFS